MKFRNHLGYYKRVRVLFVNMFIWWGFVWEYNKKGVLIVKGLKRMGFLY